MKEKTQARRAWEMTGSDSGGEEVCSGQVSRREFVVSLGAGLLVTVCEPSLRAQSSRGRDSRRQAISARVHISDRGGITVMTGKIEMGQGARAELTQAAAEELAVVPEQIQLIMGDTDLTPDDGITAGSRTTPSTVPAVRQGTAAARELLVKLAARRWQVGATELQVKSGKVMHPSTGREATYGDLVKDDSAREDFDAPVPTEVTLVAVKDWKTMGTSLPRPNGLDIVTGRHLYPSDLRRKGMLHGQVLRPPSFGARLTFVDLSPGEAMPGVVVIKEGEFVGVAAPSSHEARAAIEAISRTARWESKAQPSSKEVFDYLRNQARTPEELRFSGPSKPAGTKQLLHRTYRTAYIQHAPMEPRAALAEWEGTNLTVHTGTQNPFGYRSEIAAALGLSRDQVRVVVPDFGGGFGGKHTAETAIEAARLARGARRPVLVRWSRAEEFTWAYFRPAALIEAEAGLDQEGRVLTWRFVNINSGQAAVDSPYQIPSQRCRFVASNSPLRQGSYRTLAATANVFARETLMDELAHEAKRDPLEFRLAHLDNPRLRAVLEAAANRFGWKERLRRTGSSVGIGLACGTEKGSFLATCVEVHVDAGRRDFRIEEILAAFECGAKINPDNLMAQAKSCILMGLGGALWEEMEFSEGRILNASFGRYRVPRFKDVPRLEVHLLDRPDLSSVGAGETPILGIAPAIGNALFHATGIRIRQMPIMPAWKSQAKG
ncbi:MAG TPA: molybdopterin-dependent oxidoreductase [Candidatus Paceibacterota bacterium]|nr:molybdopterin-dependent oxidoreductase [Verrucomicrobiota bacterium]HRY48903.1 molybdopterin-dependent oxidoreductase [Candidatus Paceibacterota bacterium]HRZ99958.1 molybdopterin-dependent oxidoreductase [Candidatus Paceibacterota bacterium]